MLTRSLHKIPAVLWAALAVTGCCFAAEPNQLSAEEKSAGWRLLFDGASTEGWRNFKKTTFPSDGWKAKDGWLHCLGTKGGDIITDAQFENFEFQWEWRLAAKGNSGLKYFVTESRPSPTAHEYQLIDDTQNDDAKLRNGRRVTAGLYDILIPVNAKPRPMGEINQSRLLVQGGHVEHWLNGTKVLEYDCDSDTFKAAVMDSKFKNTPGFGRKIKGHLLLQDHHCEIWFRNLKIRELR